jgi:hypothetical protein
MVCFFGNLEFSLASSLSHCWDAAILFPKGFLVYLEREGRGRTFVFGG